MKKLTYILILLPFLLFVAQVNAQSRVIQGTVIDAETKLAIPFVTIKAKGTNINTTSDVKGRYSIAVPITVSKLVFSAQGYDKQELTIGQDNVFLVKLRSRETTETKPLRSSIKFAPPVVKSDAGVPTLEHHQNDFYSAPGTGFNTEEYSTIHENGFADPKRKPLSTFSIDVDKASYSNVRRFITQGQMPPKDAVRIEEMINYFDYDYPQPTGKHPFSVTTEMSICPWNTNNRLILIGLKGKTTPPAVLPPSNLVFLIDVSGSMNSSHKLPLVKAGLKLLVEQLRPQDEVSIVVYAGAAGLILPPTGGNKKATILQAIDRLEAGGSTAGGDGILLAYRIAQGNFKKGGNNRIILATDGDFNVGASSNAEMERLVEEKRKSGVFLTVLGFGMGNYKDSKMEILADKGNGNYAYIDNILEAKKVLVNEFAGTMFTIAKDVKLQLEFNPAKVKAYRLIGYENRALKDEEFNDDKKDAGELGAGHSVTALYEIVPANAVTRTPAASVDKLKYQQILINPAAKTSNEVLTVKLRYKEPNSETSKLMQSILQDKLIDLNKTSDNFRFAAAVAQYGMLLRNSEFKGKTSYPELVKLAMGARGKDTEGYRVEFINLVKSSELLTR